MRVSPAAGAYRHLVSLQSVDGVNEFNEPTKNFVEVAKVWASIAPASATSAKAAHETLAAGTLVASDYYVIEMHPYPGVAPSWRVVDDAGVIYDVQAARLSNTQDTLTLIARIGASNG